MQNISCSENRGVQNLLAEWSYITPYTGGCDFRQQNTLKKHSYHLTLDSLYCCCFHHSIKLICTMARTTSRQCCLELPTSPSPPSDKASPKSWIELNWSELLPACPSTIWPSVQQRHRVLHHDGRLLMREILPYTVLPLQPTSIARVQLSLFSHLHKTRNFIFSQFVLKRSAVSTLFSFSFITFEVIIDTTTYSH